MCCGVISILFGWFLSVPSLHALVNPQRACAARVTVLGLCVCVSITQHLTFHVFICATNDTNLLGDG